MSLKTVILSFGFDKDGHPDFAVSGLITSLSYDKMNELRAIIPVGIGTAEDLFKREVQRRFPASQAKRIPTT